MLTIFRDFFRFASFKLRLLFLTPSAVNKEIKKYIVFLIIGILLYPSIYKNIHDVVHSDDFHCSSTSEKHIHLPSHQCSICNQTSLITYINTSKLTFSLEQASFSFEPSPITILFNIFFGFSFSLRAPPFNKF